jgi:7,8-dihydropterin-6-yl-methyl-4-(beta-D-ribofuranosyl)aminobenzene 5'-phosphate synthase
MQPITRREAIDKGSRFLLGAAACSFFPGFLFGCSEQKLDQGNIAEIRQQSTVVDLNDIQLTVVYDNVPYRKALRTDWGFACLVEGLDKTILFDSGRYDDLFVSNLSKLQIDPQQIDELFLSHDHPDHIGGTLKLAKINPDITVTLVNSFPLGFKKAVGKTGAGITEIEQPQVVSGAALSLGEMHSAVKNEQALMILTDKGSIIITGCAHPGVVEIVERATQISSKAVVLLAGGFHLLMDNESNIREIAVRLKELGVQYVAPSHCSGGEARQVFAKVYGDRFLESGVGRTITANVLL